MKSIKALIAVFVVVSGCQTVLENVPVPDIPEKVVVYGNIDEDATYHSISVTKSKPIINNTTSSDFESINDAQVMVTSGANTYDFVYNGSLKEYEYFGIIDLSNNQVDLNVITPDLGSVKSTVIVPQEPSTYILLVDSIVRSWDTEYAVQFTLPASNVKQFYRLEGFVAYATDTFSAYSSDEFQSNEGSINEEFKMKTTFYKQKDQNGKQDHLYINYSSITEDSYRYGKALENYSPNNPFAEPTPLPSNIEGGLGVFAVSKTERIRIN